MRRPYNNRTNRFIGDTNYKKYVGATGDAYIKGLRLDSKLYFGKYKGKTISNVLYNDLPYMRWMKDATKVLFHPEVVAAIINATQHLKTGS